LTELESNVHCYVFVNHGENVGFNFSR